MDGVREMNGKRLLMGSKEDEMVRKDFQKEYETISGLSGAETCIFKSEFHPAIVSNRKQAAKVM